MINKTYRKVVYTGILLVLAAVLLGRSNDVELEPWHTEILSGEFKESMRENSVRSFSQYLELEKQLFNQLDAEIYTETLAGPEHSLKRYNRGSLSDPGIRQPNWNRTFELNSDEPRGGVLLLHGMSDSPYSLRALGQTLHQRNYHVLGLRLPGHGTLPSGLRTISWRDMSAAVSLAMEHLASRLGPKPVHIIGYSMGAPLALNFTLEAMEKGDSRIPTTLVLIAPAIRVHPSGAFARFKDAISLVPGLERMAYLSIMDEFDPYKYNSFATNAARQVYEITQDIDKRILSLARNPGFSDALPPILVLKPAVDSTVTTEAVIDNLLNRLSPGKNELVLFDINRHAAVKSTLLVSDPGPLTARLMADNNLPFALTLITNASETVSEVVAQHKDAFSTEISSTERLSHSWPSKVVSLSHVALTFPPDDPLYGDTLPKDETMVFLGNLAFRGERGLLKISSDWLLRMRYNPFYAYLEKRLLEWFESAE